mmetsp:Transcript_7077/g.16782  ORF Transcript_7077/g.16782 Transcript_7077/m.16782 type:complete len:265 (+) Transcript_7077:569-1363(+)
MVLAQEGLLLQGGGQGLRRQDLRLHPGEHGDQQGVARMVLRKSPVLESLSLRLPRRAGQMGCWLRTRKENMVLHIREVGVRARPVHASSRRAPCWRAFVPPRGEAQQPRTASQEAALPFRRADARQDRSLQREDVHLRRLPEQERPAQRCGFMVLQQSGLVLLEDFLQLQGGSAFLAHLVRSEAGDVLWQEGHLSRLQRRPIWGQRNAWPHGALQRAIRIPRSLVPRPRRGERPHWRQPGLWHEVCYSIQAGQLSHRCRKSPGG